VPVRLRKEHDYRKWAKCEGLCQGIGGKEGPLPYSGRLHIWSDLGITTQDGNADFYEKPPNYCMLQLNDTCLYNYVGQAKHICGLDPAPRVLVSDLSDHSDGS
jgi:hypothetical protein